MTRKDYTVTYRTVRDLPAQTNPDGEVLVAARTEFGLPQLRKLSLPADADPVAAAISVLRAFSAEIEVIDVAELD